MPGGQGVAFIEVPSHMNPAGHGSQVLASGVCGIDHCYRTTPPCWCTRDRGSTGTGADPAKAGTTKARNRGCASQRSNRIPPGIAGMTLRPTRRQYRFLPGNGSRRTNQHQNSSLGHKMFAPSTSTTSPPRKVRKQWRPPLQRSPPRTASTRWRAPQKRFLPNTSTLPPTSTKNPQDISSTPSYPRQSSLQQHTPSPPSPPSPSKTCRRGRASKTSLPWRC